MTVTTHRVSRYTLESMDPYLSGVKQWPVIKPMRQSMPNVLGCLLGAGIHSTTCMRWLMDSEGQRLQCRYFLICTQGGALTGEAYVLYTRYHQGVSQVRLAQVAVCDHQRVGHSGPEDRMRGWHKATCVKCNLNMTVDSGD